MNADEIVDRELMRSRFLRLSTELIRGQIARTTFQPWEIDLILDASVCKLDPKRRDDVLRQYQKAVERQLDIGDGPPMKLSAYLEQRAVMR